MLKVTTLRRTDDDRRGWLAMRALTTIPPAACLHCRSDRGLRDVVPSAVDRLPACSCAVRNTRCGSAWCNTRIWMRRPRRARMHKTQYLARLDHIWKFCCFRAFYLVSCSQPSSEHMDKLFNTCFCVRCWLLTRLSLFCRFVPSAVAESHSMVSPACPAVIECRKSCPLAL